MFLKIIIADTDSQVGGGREEVEFLFGFLCGRRPHMPTTPRSRSQARTTRSWILSGTTSGSSSAYMVLLCYLFFFPLCAWFWWPTIREGNLNEFVDRMVHLDSHCNMEVCMHKSNAVHTLILSECLIMQFTLCINCSNSQILCKDMMTLLP
jgi:hypothetical protein